ncbi:MAG: hypothetical protein JKY29_00855 [Gammaproteobacteria bacterium]|nr:hypothetical protein [Gammaproteobacteria bacterium]
MMAINSTDSRRVGAVHHEEDILQRKITYLLENTKAKLVTNLYRLCLWADLCIVTKMDRFLWAMAHPCIDEMSLWVDCKV